jgi:MraZ protein
MNFCGQEICRIDQNGRVKMPPRLLDPFKKVGLDVVVHCLIEGALAIYPENTWMQMRGGEPRPAQKTADSVVFRRQSRLFGAFSQPQTVTGQGRITIPPLFREQLELLPGTEAIVVGAEIGIEIWNKQRWLAELEKIQEHELQRADLEMKRSLDEKET